MIVTEKFVFIHFAKTGGTFVAEMLDRFYKKLESNKSPIRRGVEKVLIRTGIKEPSIKVIDSQVQIPHINRKFSTQAPCYLIEQKDRQKEIVSVIRNPLDHYVSIYEFKYWQRFPTVDVDVIKAKFPNYPDLSFDEFMEMEQDLFLKKLTGNKKFNVEIGFLTWYFITYYFKNPEAVLDKLSEGYLTGNDYKQDMYNVNFFRTQTVNQNLFDLLIKHGYEKADAEFICVHDKVLPGGRGRTKDQNWQKYYSKELLEKVIFQDRFLFRLFPEFLSEATLA